MIVEVLEAVFLVLAVLIMAYVVRHFVFAFVALKNAKKQDGTFEVEKLHYKPSVSVLIPACDEERVIGRLLQRMTELTYPKDKLQIIVIDDASKDRTGEIAEEFAKTYAYIEVMHRSGTERRRGKAAALNAAIQRIRGEVIFFFDADYYPQKDILEKLVQEFVDPEVGAVQGRVTVLNEPKNLVTRLVSLERIGGYRVDQQARNSLGLIPQFGGT